MPKPIKFRGRVADDGTPSAALLANVTSACRPFAGREVTIEVADALRSNSANGHYWGFVVGPVQSLFAEAGYGLTKKQTHDWLKDTFLGVEVIEVPDPHDLEVVKTMETTPTTRTDAWTFAEYVTAIQSHPPFVDAGLFIPEPEGKLRGRTIHEPGGTRLTFRDPKAEAPEESVPTPEESGEAPDASAAAMQHYLGERF